MSLDAVAGRRRASPSLPGRSTPVNLSSHINDSNKDDSFRNDKSYRRYAAGIERALASFDPTQQEWADYIAFLARLSKAVQALPNTVTIPHARLMCLRLAQCLSPTLPSGVHQKALEVYEHIFTSIRADGLTKDLNVYLPPLVPVLSFASLSIRPLFYSLLETHLLRLDQSSLRPAAKSIILALLPGIEDETSEDFDRAIDVLDGLRRVLSRTNEPLDGDRPAETTPDRAAYFWQCLFLAAITSPTKRQGALIYMTRRLPQFGSLSGDQPEATTETHAILYPDPGLIIRCFASGFRDPQNLIQRGFLDLLVSHLPLHCTLLQKTVHADDSQMLMASAITILLRRDMSLNRRLWAWLLGPVSTNANQEGSESAPPTPISASHDRAEPQAEYFRKYGLTILHHCILSLLADNGPDAKSYQTQPYRILISLMDRGEVAANLIPDLFVPALRYVQSMSATTSPQSQAQNDLLRSASLFFDAVETQLIWSRLVSLLLESLTLAKNEPIKAIQHIDLLLFVVAKFNVKEEEMLQQHLPNALLLTLDGLDGLCNENNNLDTVLAHKYLSFIYALAILLPDEVRFGLLTSGSSDSARLETMHDPDVIIKRVRAVYTRPTTRPRKAVEETSGGNHGLIVLQRAFHLIEAFAQVTSERAPLQLLLDTIIMIYPKVSDDQRRAAVQYFSQCLDRIATIINEMAVSKAEVPFALLATRVGLLTMSQHTATNTVTQQFKYLESHLDIQTLKFLWDRLAADRPNHHVEAVRLIWQMHAIAPGPISSGLALFFGRQLDSPSFSIEQSYENYGRFTVLWELTMSNHAIKKRENSIGGGRRRSSNMLTVIDMASNDVDYEQALTRPLFMMLDQLSHETAALAAFVSNWLRNSSTLDRVLNIVFARLTAQYRAILDKENLHIKGDTLRRQHSQAFQEIASAMNHVLQILKHASPDTWQTLSDLQLDTGNDSQDIPSDGLTAVARICVGMLRMPAVEAPLEGSARNDTKQHSLSILQLLLASPEPRSLVDLALELQLIPILKNHVSKESGSLQTILLDTIHQALSIRALSIQVAGAGDDHQKKSQMKPSASAQTFAQRLADPPPEVVQLIVFGLSSRACRTHLENWVAFMDQIFPFYGDSILTAMIPLTECLCKQIDDCFRFLVASFAKSSHIADMHGYPSSALSSLLTGLDLLLANPHLHSQDTGSLQEAASTADSAKAQHGISSMVPGLFSSEGSEGRMSRVNSRLTLILCIHDSLRTCFTIWIWASSSPESTKTDPSAAATAALTSLKLRQRTKRMIDNFFFAEGLECLEAMIVISKEVRVGRRDPTVGASVMTLLHTLHSARPREILPIILNALYSRTDPEALERSKRSTLTCDLSGIDIVIFLLNYLRTMEDDAMDDIWTECTTFLRDVLSNPLPHRAVLPILLEVVFLIAEKIDNTNHAEQRKMHRDLGDIFLRLLTATFTARPQDYMSPKPSSAEFSGRSSKASNRGRDLLDSLVIVTERLGTVLEGSDRITAAVNSVTTNVITPSLHAKGYPENVGPAVLQLLQNLANHGSDAKLWRKDVSDAFNDPRFFGITPDLARTGWYPVLRKWCIAEKDRVPELLTRIVGPATAGIMFGVGANAARMEADRKTQSTLRRIAILFLACDADFLVTSVHSTVDKLAELLSASPASSPSSATRADVFMMCRALILCNSELHLGGLWPLINSALVETLSSVVPGASEQDVNSNNNPTLLQACKLLDILATLRPDDFQLHEWLYLSDTVDAVYRPTDVPPTALADQIAEVLSSDHDHNVAEARTHSSEEANHEQSIHATGAVSGAPFLSQVKMDSRDMKAMARDDFVRTTLQPFFGQLSMHTYETTYGLAEPDIELCRADLLNDLLDQATIA